MHHSIGQDLFKSFTSAGHTSLTSPRSEAGSSIWDQSSVHTDNSEGPTPRHTNSHTLKDHRRSKSRDSIIYGDNESIKSKKKSHKNRIIDIEDIKIEFDPQKEFLWEMRKKYEWEKLKKQKNDIDNDSAGYSGYSSDDNKLDDFSLVRSASQSGKSSTCSLDSLATADTGPETQPTPTSTNLPDTNTNEAADLHRDHDAKEDSASSGVEAVDNYSIMSETHQDDTHNLDNIELVVLHRLPGEKLGMGLSIESVGGDNDPVKGVYVESVTPGGAADRATGGSWGLRVGDEMLEVNGTPLREVSYSETVTFFREMPLRVIFMVRRKLEAEHEAEPEASTSVIADTEPHSDPDDDADDEDLDEQYANLSSRAIPQGFEMIEVIFYKQPTDSLGLSIVPSYGSTKHLYQVSLTFIFP